MNRRIKKKKQKQLIERGWTMVIKMISAYNIDLRKGKSGVKNNEKTSKNQR